MVAFVAVTAGSLVLAAPRVADFVGAHRSNPERISLDALAERSMIYDAYGNLAGTMTNREDPQNRSQVALDQIPETVIESVLAQEDAHFYEHKGVNVRSILRAAEANLESGGVAQGGSTITQQVVKIVVGDDETLTRKLREAVLALELEKQMSKNEILERYLNSVYFGGGAYGIQAAAEYFFSKDVSELDWAEGAMLAAVIRSPSVYDPFKNPELARERRSLVFRRLIETGALTEEEVAFSEGMPLPTEPNRPEAPYDYFLEEVKQQLLHDPSFGLGATDEARYRSVYEGGIKVFTTFDPIMQAQAEQARDETLPNSNGDGTFDVRDPQSGDTTFGTQALASVEPSTGAVRVMVGGPGFEAWQYNLATQRNPGRQPGSTMKVFVAATLLEQGYVASDTASGAACSFNFPGQPEPYRPRTGRVGTTTIARLIQVSSNCGLMRLGLLAGVDEVAAMATDLGIRSNLYLQDREGNPTAPPYNLPLGTMGVSPLDMAAAYAVFANDGLRNAPYLVERIEDRYGKVIYQHRHRPERVIDRQTARQMNEMLAGVVTSGTGRNAQLRGGHIAAGKTGTTNDSTDVWFVGYTPQLSTAVWMGAPIGSISLANAGLGGATGGRYAATTWANFTNRFLENQEVETFPEAADARSGRYVGRVPFEAGRSGSSRSTPTRRTSGSTTRTTAPAAEPEETSPPTAPDAGDGNDGDGDGGGEGGGPGGGDRPDPPATPPPGGDGGT